MRSSEVKAFLSCSFRKEDTKINDIVICICEALDIKCVNVSDGYSATPPEKAKELIINSQIVIAIATRREKLEAGEYNMPDAVHDEISMAYALEKPILVIKEKGVPDKGFLNNYCTHLGFEKRKINTLETLRSLIASIHQIKVESIESHDLVADQEPGFFAEKVDILNELVKMDGEYIWQYSSSRKFIFTKQFAGIIKMGAWSEFVPTGVKSKIKWDIIIKDSSKKFDVNPRAEIDTPQRLKLAIDVSPLPEPGDYINLITKFTSNSFNAIIKEQLADQRYKVFNRKYDCIDGFIPNPRVKNMRVQFRFPSEYNLRKENVVPFVGSYSTGINYLVDSEMKRNKLDVDDFGGNIIASIESESPLLGHMYGIVWDIPEES